MPWTCLVRSANADTGAGPGSARRSPSPRPPAPATCPWTRSGRTDRGSADQQAASCHHLPSAISRATSARRGDSRAAASSSRLGRGYALRAPRLTRKGRAWPRCGRRCTSTSASRCGRPGRSAQALSPARVAAQSRAMAKAGRNQHMHGCPGRPVLRCSGHADHQDQVTPPNLPGGKPGSGPSPGGDFGSGLTWVSPPGSAAQPTRPKGDPR